MCKLFDYKMLTTAPTLPPKFKPMAIKWKGMLFISDCEIEQRVSWKCSVCTFQVSTGQLHSSWHQASFSHPYSDWSPPPPLPSIEPFPLGLKSANWQSKKEKKKVSSYLKWKFLQFDWSSWEWLGDDIFAKNPAGLTGLGWEGAQSCDIFWFVLKL